MLLRLSYIVPFQQQHCHKTSIGPMDIYGSHKARNIVDTSHNSFKPNETLYYSAYMYILLLLYSTRNTRQMTIVQNIITKKCNKSLGVSLLCHLPAVPMLPISILMEF